MKKILIILAILTIGVFGQNTDKSTKLLTQQEITNRLFENTIEATRVKVVNTSSPIEKDESDFTDGTESFATATDTLSGVGTSTGDTVVFNMGNQFRTVAIVIRDTAVGTTGNLIDSVKIETYNSTLAVWTTKATGFYDAGTGDILFGDAIVPGNGITKKYYLNCLYPSQVRISWVYGANKTGRIVPIAFEGSN